MGEREKKDGAWDRFVFAMGVVLLAGILGAPSAVVAQVDDEPSKAEQTEASFFRQKDLDERRAELRRYFAETVRGVESEAAKQGRGKMPERFAEEITTQLSRQLALNGVTPSDLEAMEEEGFEPAKGFLLKSGGADGARHNTQAFALKHDLVVVGTVTSVEMTDAPKDGFTTTFKVRVDERLRGMSDPVITVRQKTGRTQGLKRMRTHSGQIMDVLRDPDAVVGRTYLFFLSSGVYEYERALHKALKLGRDIEGDSKQGGRSPTYALGEAHQMEGGEIAALKGNRDSMRDASRAPASTDEMFRHIRQVDQVLRRNSK